MRLAIITGILLVVAGVVAPRPASVQTGKIAGQLTDDTGTPLPGVNLYIKTLGQGGVSDLDGY